MYNLFWKEKLAQNFTLCPKLYFPYHHLYTNIQNVNIIAIIASDFTSNFCFCGLGAYHSFCTKKFTNFTFHIIICTQISKYPNVNIIAIIVSDFTSNFGFCGLGVYHSFCIVNFVYPGSCYLHTIIMHKTVIVSLIKAITVFPYFLFHLNFGIFIFVL